MRLALIAGLGLAVAALYWVEYEYTLVETERGVPFLFRVGLTWAQASYFLDVVGNCAAIVLLVSYLAVILALILKYRALGVLRALPLIMIGAACLALILLRRQPLYWLADTVIWGLPIAVGVTLLLEFLAYYRAPVRQE